MTIEEAIKFLSYTTYLFHNSKKPFVEPLKITIDDTTVKYLELAIEALKNERQQGELSNEVWKLYEKHQSHLATHVIEFGDELKELLGKYQKGGAK